MAKKDVLWVLAFGAIGFGLVTAYKLAPDDIRLANFVPQGLLSQWGETELSAECKNLFQQGVTIAGKNYHEPKSLKLALRSIRKNGANQARNVLQNHKSFSSNISHSSAADQEERQIQQMQRMQNYMRLKQIQRECL